MARNRTIYQVLASYVSQVPPDGDQTVTDSVKQLSRIQSFDEDFSRNFTDVNQYGNLAAIDRIEVETPTVNASFSYFSTNGQNEHNLGLNVGEWGSSSQISCISDILTKATDEKNYYLLIADEGNDSSSYTGANTGCLAIGNGFMTSYSVNAAVGDIPTVSVDIEALNIRIYSELLPDGVVGPGVDPVDGQILTGSKFILPQATAGTGANTPNALQPGDISFNLPANSVMGFSETDLKVQDFTLSFDLSRTPLQKLGTRFAFSREIDFPVTASLEVNAEVGDLESGNLSQVICENENFNFDISLREPSCAGLGPVALQYQFKGAKLVSQNFSSSIGDNATMSATYEVQIGGPQEFDKGIFISGAYSNIPWLSVYNDGTPDGGLFKFYDGESSPLITGMTNTATDPIIFSGGNRVEHLTISGQEGAFKISNFDTMPNLKSVTFLNCAGGGAGTTYRIDSFSALTKVTGIYLSGNGNSNSSNFPGNIATVGTLDSLVSFEALDLKRIYKPNLTALFQVISGAGNVSGYINIEDLEGVPGQADPLTDYVDYLTGQKGWTVNLSAP